MKIYVAGKITGEERSAVEKKFQAAKELLVNKGHSVFIPTVLPDYKDVSHEDYLYICYSMIDVCDAVYMLDNWQNSKGARMELQHAADFDKQIIYQDEKTREHNYPNYAWTNYHKETSIRSLIDDVFQRLDENRKKQHELL